MVLLPLLLPPTILMLLLFCVVRIWTSVACKRIHTKIHADSKHFSPVLSNVWFYSKIILLLMHTDIVSYHPFGNCSVCVCGCFFDSKISVYIFCTLTGCCCCCLRLLLVCFCRRCRCRHRRVSENFYENLRIRNFRTFVHFVFRMLMISDVCCVDPIVGVCVLSLCVCVCVLLLDIYGTACVWLCDFECVLLYVCCQCIYSFDCIVQ